MKSQAGKGDKPRPYNKEKYDGNWKEIKWKTDKKADLKTVACGHKRGIPVDEKRRKA